LMRLSILIVGQPSPIRKPELAFSEFLYSFQRVSTRLSQRYFCSGSTALFRSSLHDRVAF
jgi:hypothetical protein